MIGDSGISVHWPLLWIDDTADIVNEALSVVPRGLVRIVSLRLRLCVVFCVSCLVSLKSPFAGVSPGLSDAGLLQVIVINGMTLPIHSLSGGRLPRNTAVRSSMRDQITTSTLSPRPVRTRPLYGS